MEASFRRREVQSGSNTSILLNLLMPAGASRKNEHGELVYNYKKFELGF
uniref:Uncharacterized protein n=1 Tax=Rhizophora mucronata TaxID=61149 RepID=A0A2P2M2C2_RHIMU